MPNKIKTYKEWLEQSPERYQYGTHKENDTPQLAYAKYYHKKITQKTKQNEKANRR
jgi:hypothetical protein